MAPRSTEALVLQMSVDLQRFGNQLAKANDVANKRLSAVERRAMQADKNLSRIMGQAGQNLTNSFRDGLRGLAPTLAAAFSTQQVIRYADSYVGLQNRLKVTGLEGAALAQQYKELQRVSEDSRVSLEGTVNTYSRLRLASEGLGLSNADVTRTTEILSKALSASGATTQEATSALLQFGQAIGSGVLQGDELRSIRENAPEIARAIAREFETTVGGLKKLGEEGALTSDRVIQAVLKSGAAIDASFARTQGNVGQSFQFLSDRLMTYIGEADKSLGATEKMSQAIRLLADNLDVVATAAGVLVTIVGTRMTVAFVAATVSSLRYNIALQAAAVGHANLTRSAIVSATAVRALDGALKFFGGPIGLAITAVAGAVGLLAADIIKTNASARALTKTLDEYEAEQRAVAEATKTANKEQKDLIKQIDPAIVKLAQQTGQVKLLSEAWFLTAAAARQARIETAKATTEAARGDLSVAEGLKQRAQMVASAGLVDEFGRVQGNPNSARAVQQAQQNEDRARRRLQTVYAQQRLLESDPITRADLPPTVATAAEEGKGPSKSDISAARRRKELLEDLALEERLLLAREAGDKQRIQGVEDEIRLLQLRRQYESAGLSAAQVDERAGGRLAIEQRIRDTEEERAETQKQINALIDSAQQKTDQYARAQERLAAIETDRLNHEIELARLRGDDKAVKAAERELRVRERIDELTARGDPNAVANANQEAFERDLAERQGRYKEVFQNAFSEGVRAAASGDLETFLTNLVGSASERAIQNLGGALFDASGLGGLLDNILGPEAADPIEAGIISGGTIAATEIGAAITAAGAAVASLIASSATAARVSNTTSQIAAAVDSFDGGGRTRSGSRAGGLDGKGGYLAMVHPNELVTDLTRGIPSPSLMRGGAPMVVQQTFQITGAVMTDDLLRQMDQKAIAARNQAVRQADTNNRRSFATHFNSLTTNGNV